MPEEQGGTAPTVRAFLSLGTPVHPLAVHRNGLYHKTATLERMRPVVGSHRPIDKDGAHPPPRKRKDNGGGPSSNLRLGSLETLWAAQGHSFRLRFAIHLRNMARIPAAVWHLAADVDSLPPPNRRTNGMPQPDH